MTLFDPEKMASAIAAGLLGGAVRPQPHIS